MRIIRLLTFPVLLLLGAANADEVILIKDTVSPGGICIARVSSRKGDVYTFLNPKTGKKLGDVLPLDWMDVEDIQLSVKWNTRGDKVAVLAYHGPKSSQIYLYRQLPAGEFQRLDFNAPDPIEVYKQINKKPFPLSESPGGDINIVGSWIDNNTINLLSGIVKEVYTKDNVVNLGSQTLFVKYKVTLHESIPTVSKIKLIGPLSEKERVDFLKEWRAK